MILIFLLFAILPMIVFSSAITDIYSYMIPNSFSVILIVGFYIFALINPVFDWEMIGYHTLTGLSVLLLTFILFAFSALGGGDAKLLAASSLWLGYHDTLLYLCFVAMCGGILALVLVIWRKTKPFKVYSLFTPLRSLYYGPTDTSDIANPQYAIPYAVAIAAGFFMALPDSMIFVKSFA